MRLIDGDALRKKMYHEAFETDSPMQKWDSGCWIRYKMFENAIDSAPTIDAVPVVRCKDCRHRGKELCLMYYVDEGGFGYDLTRDSDYCVFGERKDDEADS